MKVHDEDRTEGRRRPAEDHRDQHDMDGEAARRAAAAGHVQTVEHGAVLRLQRLAGNAGVGSLVDAEPDADNGRRSPVLDVVGKGGGAPLPPGVRAPMEAGLGADLSAVRVHDDDAAAASAQAVQAKAYTVGNDVVFNRGAYQPGTDEGQHTLAHELTHVLQQRSGPVDGTATGDGIVLSNPDDRFEREAEATAVSLGRSEPAATGSSAGTVQRQEAENEDVGAQAMPLQREEAPEEEEEPEEPEPAQAMPLQREGPEEEEEQPM